MKEFDLIIKNGTVVTSTESFLCDVAVKDGKIAAMAQNIEADAKEIYDAAGKLVLPGALDAHTHMAMPFGGTVSADSYMVYSCCCLWWCHNDFRLSCTAQRRNDPRIS